MPSKICGKSEFPACQWIAPTTDADKPAMQRMLQMTETEVPFSITLKDPQVKQSAPTPDKPKQPEFGSGRYSLAMKEVYQDGIRIFGFSPEVSEKVARQFGSDFGAYMRESIVEVKVGKSINKDGKITLAEASKVKGCTATNSILTARAIDYCNNALKFNVSVRNTKWQLADELAQWIESLAK